MYSSRAGAHVRSTEIARSPRPRKCPNAVRAAQPRSCRCHQWQLSRRVAKGIRAATYGAGCPPRQLLRLVGRWGDICAHARHRASEASDIPVPPALRNSTKNIPAPPLALTRCANMRPKSAVANQRLYLFPPRHLRCCLPAQCSSPTPRALARRRRPASSLSWVCTTRARRFWQT